MNQLTLNYKNRSEERQLTYGMLVECQLNSATCNKVLGTTFQPTISSISQNLATTGHPEPSINILLSKHWKGNHMHTLRVSTCNFTAFLFYSFVFIFLIALLIFTIFLVLFLLFFLFDSFTDFYYFSVYSYFIQSM